MTPKTGRSRPRRSIGFSGSTRPISPNPELLLNLYAIDGGRREEMFGRAIRDLVADGLLRIDGDSIVPTLPAIRAEEIRR